MRRALLAGAILGVVTGAVFIHRDALRLTVAWPLILGFALWESVGHRGSRGILAALSAGGGAVAAYGVFFMVTEFLPVTDLWLGIMSGLAIGVLVVIALLSRDWIPVSAPMIGFAAFFGVFEPQWRQSPSNFLTHGLDAGSVVGLGMVVGILAAAGVRWLTEGGKERSLAWRRDRERPTEEPTAPLSEMLEGGGGE
jgi:hypothetical protein